MGENMIAGVILTPLKIIEVPGGPVMHAMKSADAGYSDFGEAYFTSCEQGAIKAWRRHKRMTLNLIVPVGEMLFALYDDREQDEGASGCWQRVTLSTSNYARLTVPPQIWFGFQGLSSGMNMLLNIADIPHDPDEAEKREINDFKFDWA